MLEIYLLEDIFDFIVNILLLKVFIFFFKSIPK